MGIAGILNIPKTLTNLSYKGSVLFDPHNDDMLVVSLFNDYAILFNPNLAVEISLLVKPQHELPDLEGMIKVQLERHGVSLQPTKLEKLVRYKVAAMHQNFTFEFYPLEENYFELNAYILGETNNAPVYLEWHVQPITLDFSIATASPLLIIMGTLTLLEAIRLFYSFRYIPLREMERLITIFLILSGILIFLSHDLSHLLYYFSLAPEPFQPFFLVLLGGDLALFVFLILIYLYAPKIMKRRYKLKKLENHKVVEILSQKFGKLNLYLFSSNIPNAYLIGTAGFVPELGISTSLLEEFEKGNINQNDLINIAAHEIGHIINKDVIAYNFCRALLTSYKYWLLIYVIGFWFLQLLRVNPYGWVAPIVYLSSTEEFLRDLLAGLHFLLKGDFAAAKAILPFLDISILTSFVTLPLLIIVPHILLKLFLCEGQLAADRLACSYFTTKESMKETIIKVSRFYLLKKIGWIGFNQEPTPSQRIRSLYKALPDVNLYYALINGLGIGLLSFSTFRCFDEPFLTLFFYPLIGICFLQALSYYLSWLIEAESAESVGKISLNLRKLFFESLISSAAHSLMAILALITSEELCHLGCLVALLTSSLFMWLASFLASVSLLAIKVVSLKFGV